MSARLTRQQRSENERRAGQGAYLVSAYINELGGDGHNALRDMLADLMHYAACEKLPFCEEYQTAQMHFNAESRGEA